MQNYVKELDTFLFRRAWGAAFNNVSDREAGELIKGIYRYMDGEDPAEFSSQGIANLYELIRAQLNHSAYRYLEKIKTIEDE